MSHTEYEVHETSTNELLHFSDSILVLTKHSEDWSAN